MQNIHTGKKGMNFQFRIFHLQEISPLSILLPCRPIIYRMTNFMMTVRREYITDDGGAVAGILEEIAWKITGQAAHAAVAAVLALRFPFLS